MSRIASADVIGSRRNWADSIRAHIRCRLPLGTRLHCTAQPHHTKNNEMAKTSTQHLMIKANLIASVLLCVFGRRHSMTYPTFLNWGFARCRSIHSCIAGSSAINRTIYSIISANRAVGVCNVCVGVVTAVTETETNTRWPAQLQRTVAVIAVAVAVAQEAVLARIRFAAVASTFPSNHILHSSL